MAETSSDEKQCCWMVRPRHGGPWLVCVSQAEIDDSLDGAERGDYEIVEVLMTQAEIEALGEFQGW